jgi:hypothetical protein
MFEALNKLFSLSGVQLFYLVFGLISGIVAIVAMLLLKAYLRSRALRPIGGKSLDSMNIDDLERMRETGLLDEEEVKRIRQRLAQQFIEQKSARKSPAARLPVEVLLAQAEEEAQQSGDAEAPQSGDILLEESAVDPLSLGVEPEVEPSKPHTAEPKAAAEQPPAPRYDFDKLDPIEIEELFHFGAITNEEYEAIKKQRGLT